MWGVALGMFAALKLVTWAKRTVTSAKLWKQLAYLLGWPGMDADAFLEARPKHPPAIGTWAFAWIKMLFGLAVLLLVVPRLPAGHPYLIGWVGMWGIVFLLHFGLFDVLACTWQQLGIRAVPIMNWPPLAKSLSEFWGQRWNLAFRDATHRYLFRPLVRVIGPVGAMLSGFLVSGLIHDLVISLPAGGGYGLPTVYFMLQGFAILLERSRWGRATGLDRGWRGWVFAASVVVLPCPLLFHPPFVCGVMFPFFQWLGLTS
jgi:alginate O-acetyltransferase complex protein AlgI